MNFNWRTGDEQDWDHEPATAFPAGEKRRGGRRRRWLVLLLTLFAGVLVLERTLRVQIDRNRLAMDADVRASLALVHRAIDSGDEELLKAVLSGRDPAWTTLQGALLRRGLLAAGAATPFGFDAEDALFSHEEIAWSPDLETALVTSHFTVTVAQGQPHAGKPVTWKQTNVYRRGTDRWLLAPPTAGDWGSWRSERADHVLLSFRQRDAPAASQLLPILNGAVESLCEVLAATCAPDNPYRVRLDPDGKSLERLRDDRLPTFRFGELRLPSPSLVGYSTDPVGAATLYRGYAHYLLVAVAQELLDFDCCQGAQFMDALASSVAHELGYGRSPLQADHFVPMVDALQGLGRFNRLWWGAYRSPFTEADRAQVAAFNDFLSAQSGASKAELQKALAASYGFWGWVQPFVQFDVVADRDELEAAWRDYVLAQANAVQPELAQSPLPQQTLSLICEDTTGQRALYGYDPLSDLWTVVYRTMGRAPALMPTPGDDGVLLFDRVAAESARQPARLLLGDEDIPLPAELAPAYSLPGDPQGRYMPVWRLSQDGRSMADVALVDLTSCHQNGGCRQRSLNGSPSWSTSGEQLLLWAPESGAVYHGSRDLLSFLDAGIDSSQPPFWLDEQTAVIVSEDGSSLQSVQFATGRPVKPKTMLSLEQVLLALGRAGDGRNWRFGQPYGVPGAQALVGAVMLPESSARHYFLARFDGWQLPVDVTPLVYAPQLTASAPDTLISGSGNWLALHLYPETLRDARFVLHDLRTGAVVLDTTSPYFIAARAHDWSGDGQWLARIGPYYVELATAGRGTERPLVRRFVSSGQLQCSSVAWVNRP